MEVSGALVLHDQNEEEYVHSVQNHIKADDYFATTATVLDLSRQMLEKDENQTWVARQVAKHLAVVRDEQLYLQKHYKLCKKDT